MWFRALPPTLVAAVLCSLASQALLVYDGLGDLALPAKARWVKATWGLDLAVVVLVAAAAFELARRLTGRARRCMYVSGVLCALIAVDHVVLPVVSGLAPHLLAGTDRITAVAFGLVNTAAAVLFVTALDGWRRAPIAAGLVVVAPLLDHWVPGLTRTLGRVLPSDPTFRALLEPGLWAAAIVARVWVTAVRVREVPTTIADPAAGAAGLRLAAGVLWLRLAIAAIVAIAAVGAGAAARTTSFTRMILYAAPAVTAVLAIACAVGLLRTAASRADGVPAGRLVAAAIAMMWWGQVESRQIWWLYDLDDSGYRLMMAYEKLVASWSIAGPVLAALGLVLGGSAVASIAAARRDDELYERAAWRVVLFVALTSVSMMLAHMVSASTRDGVLALTAVQVVINASALAALASVFARGAAALEPVTGLPAARVLPRGGGPGDGAVG